MTNTPETWGNPAFKNFLFLEKEKKKFQNKNILKFVEKYVPF